MMRKTLFLSFMFILALLLTACGGDAAAPDAPADAGGGEGSAAADQSDSATPILATRAAKR